MLTFLQILKHCSICSSLNSSADPSQSTPSSPDDQTEDVLAVVHDDISANMPHGWRVNGVHKLTYHHPACEGAVCCVACVPVGSLLAIHGKDYSTKVVVNKGLGLFGV